MTEKDLQTKIIKLLESKGYWCIKTINVSRAGCPDIICSAAGIFYAIEVKAENGKLSEIQKITRKQIINSGSRYFVLRPKDWEHFRHTVNRGNLPFYSNDSSHE